MKIFYVYMSNATSSEDDEVYKVKAKNKDHAREVALNKQNWAGRFSVRWVMPARPKNQKDREFLKDYRWWATDKT